MKVKLNPTIFKEHKKITLHTQAGKLNYPALLLHYEYKVVDSIRDVNHGEMFGVEPLNTKRFTGQTIWFVKDDCLLIEE